MGPYAGADYNPHTLSHSRLLSPEAEKKKKWGMGPYDGADYNPLILSHSCLLSLEDVFKEKHGLWDPMLELTITPSPYLTVVS
jgi:hypothetical protein